MGLTAFHKKDKKLKELILYIAEKCKTDPNFGAIKLNKILFLIDFEYYGWKGKSLTGTRYIHLERGPAPREIPNAITALQSENRAKVEEVDRYGYTQKRVVPLKGPDTSSFDEEEISLIDSVIERTWNANATEISKWTHKLKPWQITENGEEIPYQSLYVINDLPVEQDGINWAKKEIERLIKEHGYVP